MESTQFSQFDYYIIVYSDKSDIIYNLKRKICNFGTTWNCNRFYLFIYLFYLLFYYLECRLFMKAIKPDDVYSDFLLRRYKNIYYLL